LKQSHLMFKPVLPPFKEKLFPTLAAKQLAAFFMLGAI